MKRKPGQFIKWFGEAGRQDDGANGQEAELASQQRGERSGLSGGRMDDGFGDQGVAGLD